MPYCLSAIKRNCSSDYEVFVILNEIDAMSMKLCEMHGVNFIGLSRNEGTLAVDYAIPHLKEFKYVANLNIDMIVCPDWDVKLICKLQEYGDMATVSSPAVEYNGGANGLDTLNDPELPRFASARAIQNFSENCKQGKYKFPNIISQRHPVVCTVDNFLAVRGYSDNFDRNYYPGYSLDFDFPFRLWSELRIDKMVSVGDAPVLHDYSSTMKKLPPNLQANNCWEYFKKKNRMSIDDFKKAINFNARVD